MEDRYGSETPPEGPSRVASASSLEGEAFFRESRNASPADDSERSSPESVFSQVSESPPTVQEDNDEKTSDAFVNGAAANHTTVPPPPPPPPPPPDLFPSPPPPVGRPPLLPRGTVAPTHRRSVSDSATNLDTKLAIPKLDRNFSAGEQSNLSALTDSSGHYGLVRDRRETIDVIMPTTARDDPNPLGIVDLNLVNPLETEAEAAIMQAIERQLAEEGPASSAVLSNIPDDLVRDMISEPPAGYATPPPPSRSSNAPSAPTPNRPRLDRAPSQRLLLQPVPESLTDGMKKDESGNVHEKLFRLANQMDRVHDIADVKDHEVNLGVSSGTNHGTNHGVSQATTIHAPTLSHHDVEQSAEPVTANDQLIHNANVLFQRSGKAVAPTSEANVETPSNQVVGKKGRFWRLSIHKKKTDAATPDTHDVELGGVPCEDNGNGSANDKNESHGALRKLKALKVKSKARRFKRRAVGDMYQMYDFLRPRKQSMYSYCRALVQWVFIPTLILSVILFYPFRSNLPRTCSDAAACPSISWFLIFLFIRQAITFTIAKVLEVFFIDFLSLRHRTTVRILGPRVTLFLVQSKGWPFILFMWALLDILLLAGDTTFVNHWLYWQDAIALFNAENPAGNTTKNEVYNNVLAVSMVLAFIVSCKRLWMGIYLSKRTYRMYGKQLASVMNDMLLISLLANLGHDLEEKNRGATSTALRPEPILLWEDAKSESEADGDTSFGNENNSAFAAAKLARGIVSNRKSGLSGGDSFESSGSAIFEGTKEDAATESPPPKSSGNATNSARTDSPSSRHLPFQPSVLRSQRAKITQQLGPWDEPRRDSMDDMNNMTLAAILQFRQAQNYIDDDYPFSTLFGSARTRELCVQSSQLLYEKLLLGEAEGREILSFQTIAEVAKEKNDDYNVARLKRLYRLLRPDNEGNLTMLDFLAAIDRVYKELRLLRASISNSSQVDQAFEKIFNVVFYIILCFILLPFLGVDPMELILAISGLIVGFAFMIGPASSQYFEGILFILVRKPYDIGDRIHISDPSVDLGRDGSPGWFVEKVDLYTTTVRFATTNEVATYSNGSLARMRVVNANRSPKAIVYVNMKFAVDVKFSLIEIFRNSVETYIKARGREWVSFIAFRALRVEVDLGFVEYVVVAQHVAGWQDVAKILQSKAELNSYCLELSKQLKMRYHPPALPVHLGVVGKSESSQIEGTPTPSGAPSGALDNNTLLDIMGGLS